MVTHHQNSHGIANNTKQKMVGESPQVHAAQVMLANSEGFRSLSSLPQIVSKLGMKLIGKLLRSHPLVVTHDLVDIRINLRM